MRAPADDGGADAERGRALAACLALLALDNVLTNQILSRRWYVPTRLATAAGVTAIATRVGGCRAADLGLDPRAAAAGLRWGGAAAAGIAGGLLAASRVPATRPILSDARVRGWAGRRLAFEALWAVPAGTVVLEELAFRGALPALLGADAEGRRRGREAAAALASAALFGLWHLLPSRELADVNPALARRVAVSHGPRGLAVGAVGSSAMAGLGLAWLRRRSGSLVAPFLAHATANALGYAVAWSEARRA